MSNIDGSKFVFAVPPYAVKATLSGEVECNEGDTNADVANRVIELIPSLSKRKHLRLFEIKELGLEDEFGLNEGYNMLITYDHVPGTTTQPERTRNQRSSTNQEQDDLISRISQLNTTTFGSAGSQSTTNVSLTDRTLAALELFTQANDEANQPTSTPTAEPTSTSDQILIGEINFTLNGPAGSHARQTLIGIKERVQSIRASNVSEHLIGLEAAAEIKQRATDDVDVQQLGQVVSGILRYGGLEDAANTVEQDVNLHQQLIALRSGQQELKLMMQQMLDMQKNGAPSKKQSANAQQSSTANNNTEQHDSDTQRGTDDTIKQEPEDDMSTDDRTPDTIFEDNWIEGKSLTSDDDDNEHKV